MLATIMVKAWVPHGLLRMWKVIAWVRMARAQLLLPTAYGDGLWGLQNTDITLSLQKNATQSHKC